MDIKRTIFVNGELAGRFILTKIYGDYWWRIILGDKRNYIKLDVSRDCYILPFLQPEYKCYADASWYIKFKNGDV